MKNLNKYFYGTFNPYFFSEADFDRDAVEEKHDDIKKEVQKLFVDMKVVLDNTEKTMNKLFSETDVNTIKSILKTFKEEYQQLVNKFAKLEIEVNRL